MRASKTISLPCRSLVLCGCVFLMAIGATASADESRKQQYEFAKRSLERRMKPLREAYASMARVAASPKEIGRLLKSDPKACSAYVRGALRYEPYLGILRGSEGTLAAGGGNSAELAMLLRDMISAGDSPPKMRFAIAQLSTEQAKALLDFAISAGPAQPAMANTKHGAMPATGLAAVAAPGVAKLDGLLAAVTTHFQQLQPLLKSLPQPNRDQGVQSLEAARQHVWLQAYQDGDWRTLQVAGNVAPPQEAVRFVDELPSDWRHQVKVKVEVERLTDGNTSRATLLEQEWDSAMLFAKQIELLVVPEELSLPQMLDSKTTGKAFLDQAKQFKTFGTSIELTGEPIQQGKSFDLAGKLTAGGESGGGIGKVDVFRRAGPRAGESETHLAGVWLSIILQSPGQAPRVIERALLDRIGPAARAQKKLIIGDSWKDAQRVRVGLFQRHQVMVSAAPVPTTRMAWDALEAIVDGGVIEQSLAVKFQQTKGKLSQAVTELKLPALTPDLIQIQNDSFAFAQAEIAGNGICFIGEPQVFLRSETFDLRAANELITRDDIDIAASGIRCIGGQLAAQTARAMHGILASEMEGTAMSSGGELIHASAILRQAVQQHIELRVIHSADQLGGVDATPDSKAVMAQQLASGVTLLAPVKQVKDGDAPARYAWWRIDGEGQVLAIGADGRGQVASEGQLVLTQISVPMVKRCMKFVACFNKGVAGGGGMNESAAECLSQAIRDTVKDSLDKAIDSYVRDPFNQQMSEARAGMIGERYNKLYEKAKAAQERLQQALADPAGQVPGVDEGRAAADAGRDIGGALGFRLYLLLSMGSEITDYASQL